MTTIKYKHPDSKRKKKIVLNIFLALIIGALMGTLKKSILASAIWFVGAIIIISVYQIMKLRLDEYSKIKKMENAFPDFLQLMASNLRAGMPTDCPSARRGG